MNPLTGWLSGLLEDTYGHPAWYDEYQPDEPSSPVKPEDKPPVKNDSSIFTGTAIIVVLLLILILKK